MTNESYPRDLVGYGARPPHADWPGQARIALQFRMNHMTEGSYSRADRVVDKR